MCVDLLFLGRLIPSESMDLLIQCMTKAPAQIDKLDSSLYLGSRWFNRPWKLTSDAKCLV